MKFTIAWLLDISVNFVYGRSSILHHLNEAVEKRMKFRTKTPIFANLKNV
jgi:hypothetical protein